MSVAEAARVDRVPVSAPAARPVFVDVRGRRSRWLAWLGRVAGLVCAGYLAATVLSFVGAPWVPRLALPVLGPVLPSPKAAGAPPLGPDAVRSPLPASVLGKDPPTTASPTTALRPTLPSHPPGRPVASSPPGVSPATVLPTSAAAPT